MLFLYSFKNHFCQSHTTSQLIELDPSVVKAGLAKPQLLQELISISETNRLIETANQVWSLVEYHYIIWLGGESHQSTGGQGQKSHKGRGFFS